jgi:hypothetical protein
MFLQSSWAVTVSQQKTTSVNSSCCKALGALFVAVTIQPAQKCSTDWPILNLGSGLVDPLELEEPQRANLTTRSSTFIHEPAIVDAEGVFQLAHPLRKWLPTKVNAMICFCWASVGW